MRADVGLIGAAVWKGLGMTNLDRGTYLADEAYAYPNGGQTREGRAIYPDGKARRVWGGIPDTFYTVPAHGRRAGRYLAGYLTVETLTYDDGSELRWWAFNVRG